jgi:threonine aldolase
MARAGSSTPAPVHEGVRPPGRYSPRSRLLWVEQTSNLGGGSIWPLERIARVVEAGRGYGLATHMDGARLMNAVVASGVSARAFAEPFDTAWIDFTKGLGAPVGAALAGSRDFIAEAWRCKQQMGGAMRQAGIIAAGGVYALTHHVARLAEDHAHARRLAEGLAGLPGIKLDPAEVDTNLVFFDVTGSVDAPTAVERLLAQGIRMGAMGPRTIRAVTHLDVDRPASTARSTPPAEVAEAHAVLDRFSAHSARSSRCARARGATWRCASGRPRSSTWSAGSSRKGGGAACRCP